MKLSVTIIQTNIFWEDKNANLVHFQKKIEGIDTRTDLIILPEMFTTGFSMNPKPFAEKMDGPTFKWMLQMAKHSNAAIAGSIIIEENNHYVNRFLFVKPDGEYQYYDKRHLFAMAGEDKLYSQGNKNELIKYKGWRIRPLICYDLRFPVWSRNYDGYDLLIYVANWPEKRVAHWKTLLQARAIENQAYVAGVNRIGLDGNNYSYSGDSAIYNSLGEKISKTNSNEESVETILISRELIEGTRKKLPFLNDQDEFIVN
ncbi:MAG: amidohydrolase [Bacteroidota bacterium]